MKITRLRNRLLLSAVLISIVITLGSMGVVSWVIGMQFQNESKDDLVKVSEVIKSGLADRKNSMLTASRQLATQKSIGSTIWYLAKYGQSSVDREMLFTTYQKLAKDTYSIARVAQLSKIAIYDHTGHLVSFALRDANGEQAGFARNFATPVFQVASINENEEINRSNLHTTSSVTKIRFEFGGQLPQQEGVHYALIDGVPVLESHVPIIGEVYNSGSGRQERKQLGLIVAVQPIDQTFVDHLSRLTHIKINVFTPTGFSSGGAPEYQNADWSGIRRAEEHDPIPVFSEILIAGKGFYQSLIPLYADNQLIGGIAALHSKEIVQKNTRELLQILGLIAGISLLLVISFAWYFATSISRPLTALSRIFHGVASGNSLATLSEDLSRIKTRPDELGDLTQSFVAMNDAVNQKIQQINELNASLEHTVNERTAALATREHESRTLLENTPDTIARYDAECRRIYVNPAFGAMTEGGEAALLGKKPSEVPGGENSKIYESKIREVFASGKDTRFELKWPSKDGHEICSHIRLTAERDTAGNIISVLGVGRDITELNESRAELKRKELAKTRFLAAAGHDLRQPLAAANLFVDALKLTEPTPRQNEIIGRLDQAMLTFNDLLDALLNISKLDAGIIKPEYMPISVSELFNWLEQSLEPLASKKQIGFKLHAPLNKPLVVRSDIGLIKSVLMNLVSNAIKFTPQGSVLVCARRRGDEALFQIWDTGIGISNEDAKFIFDEFYQINNPQRDRASGLGLGLTISQRALTLLGTTITCRSQIGRGSVFEFRLPLDSATRGVKQQNIAVPIQDNSFATGKRFVLVEDDKLVAQAMISLLEEMGGEVECFHSAEDALCHAKVEQADYYIADYMLGGTLNGLQLLKQLGLKRGQPINAVLVTGDTSPTFMREAADCVWPVLHKPINISQLITSLSEPNLTAQS